LTIALNHVTQITTYYTFKRHLKTFPFSAAYGSGELALYWYWFYFTL